MAQFDDAEALEALREPGAGLVMRALDASDFDKGFVALLGQVFPPLRIGQGHAPMPCSRCGGLTLRVCS